MLTAYDALMAAEAVAGGVDIILVGDSLGKAVLGYEDEKEVTLNDMLHHCTAVLRGAGDTVVVGDLPYATYDTPAQALCSATAMMERGVSMVKLERCVPDIIGHLHKEGIPVMAHLGYTPQTAEREGSKVVGKEVESAELLLRESLEVEQAGALALVLEMVPREVAATIAATLSIPVIGIGCGPDVDGQVLVSTDMWGESGVQFKFLKTFGAIRQAKIDAVSSYAGEVRSGAYPSDGHSFHIKKSQRESWAALHDC